MSWLITPGLKSADGLAIGTPYEAGYIAGFVTYTGTPNPTHALIVAPKATGATGTGYTLTTNLQWKISQTTTTGANSSTDGAANTLAIIAAGIADHPAAQFCAQLSIGEYTDWYLPASGELATAYTNLKPTTDANHSGLELPRQTDILIFQSSGSESFVAGTASHWSSTETTATAASRRRFDTGFTTGTAKTTTYSVRAFRRIAL